MTTTPTTTPTTTRSRTLAAPDVRSVRESVRRLITQMATVEVEDTRWDTAGPLVSAAATWLRAAVGQPVVASSADAPPIVRERDLAMAALRLLAHDVQVVDARAAVQFQRLAGEISLAFS